MIAGAQSEVGAIRRILLRHARGAWEGDERIGREWRALGFLAAPDHAAAAAEYDRFAALLARLGAEPVFAPADPALGLDSIYVRDAVVLCERGAVLCRMGKQARRDEPLALVPVLERLSIPVLGAIGGAGRLEGGDVVWLDRRTLVVGRGYRTNDEGAAQLRALLGDAVDELWVVPLPHHRGPDDVFHLMSILSPIDRDLALVYSPLMPVPLRERLLERGLDLVEVPPEELDTLGCNVLAVAPRRCVMAAGSPLTRARLERAGAEVHEFDGGEICAKGSGGPTCLTRPLERG